MVLPSRLSSRAAADFFVTLGGYPIGLSTVIFSSLSSACTVARSGGTIAILFMEPILLRQGDCRVHYKASGFASTGERPCRTRDNRVGDDRNSALSAIARQRRVRQPFDREEQWIRSRRLGLRLVAHRDATPARHHRGHQVAI